MDRTMLLGICFGLLGPSLQASERRWDGWQHHFPFPGLAKRWGNPGTQTDVPIVAKALPPQEASSKKSVVPVKQEKKKKDRRPKSLESSCSDLQLTNIETEQEIPHH